MAKTPGPGDTDTAHQPGRFVGPGGEVHQVAVAGQPVLTTNHGMPISDDHNSLRAGPRGSLLLEDMVLAAVTSAQQQASQLAEQRMGSVVPGGLGGMLPGM